eukprot:scaffold12600_cov107-Isochrysis_galbana.AAC.5
MSGTWCRRADKERFTATRHYPTPEARPAQRHTGTQRVAHRTSTAIRGYCVMRTTRKSLRFRPYWSADRVTCGDVIRAAATPHCNLDQLLLPSRWGTSHASLRASAGERTTIRASGGDALALTRWPSCPEAILVAAVPCRSRRRRARAATSLRTPAKKRPCLLVPGGRGGDERKRERGEEVA